jgi:hypothetical protein
MAEASVPDRPNIHRPMAAKYLHSARIKPTETREGASRRGAMIGDRFTPGASFLVGLVKSQLLFAIT